jgi:hypothetical protein
MAFQLRERNTTTLKEMLDGAISVESNLLIKSSNMKEEEREKITKEQLKSSEAKLDILANTMKEMMPKVMIKEELVVQRYHVPFFSERERVTVPKHFAVHPRYHISENDYFMYSIHNTVQDETQNYLTVEKSIDLMCMFDEIYFMEDLPKYDQYEDDYIKVDSSNQTKVCCWEKEED